MSERITRTPAGLSVPDNARIPFSEGDGTGPDIWRAARRVLDDFLKRSFGWSIREDAGRDMANPCSVILSGALMLDYLGWREAASSIEAAVTAAIAGKAVTYDFARLMDGATQVSTSQFGERIAAHLA
jgi:isocitrate dehydrogenase